MQATLFWRRNLDGANTSSTRRSMPISAQRSFASAELARPPQRMRGRSSTQCLICTPPQRAAEYLAEELLQRSRSRPGESLRVAARRIGVEVCEKELPEGVHGFAARRIRTVVISPSGYPARDEFTLAHELMEMHIPDSWRELPRALKEEMCDRGAAALLLPAEAFCASVDRFGIDLPVLRRQWRNASWTTIARRLVDVGAASSAASWDSLELAWRYGGPARRDEEAALAEIYAGRGRARSGGVRAWRLGGAGLGRAVSVGV